MRWDDVNTRARGLATHLLDPAALRRVTELRTLEQLAQVLREAHYPIAGDGTVDLQQVLESVSEMTVRRYTLLGRWLDHRRSVLSVVYEVEERQALRALLRGTVQGISPGGKLAAVIPTPTLPLATLQQLAVAQSPKELAVLLLRHGHPAGRALEVAIKDPHSPGLLGLEMALARTFAARATRAARRGGRILRAFGSWLIDLENAWSVLQAPDWGTEVQPPEVFLSGGRVLSLARFTALAARDRADIREGLVEAFDGSPFRSVFGSDATEEVGFERQALAAEIAWCHSMTWLQPLGPAVTLDVLLRIRAEAHDIRAAAWGITLAAPAEPVRPAVMRA